MPNLPSYRTRSVEIRQPIESFSLYLQFHVVQTMSKAVDPESIPSKEAENSDLEPTKTVQIDATEQKPQVMKRIHTLGSVRHRHEHTGQLILIPTPSKDPNDPLNWYVSSHLK